MGPVRRAFTLVEILIVVIILGILAAVVIVNFADIPSSVKQTNLKEISRRFGPTSRCTATSTPTSRPGTGSPTS